jgi:broad specificity phosphatase PhoE
MDLLLIRHAQSVGNAEGRIQGQANYPLSSLGRDQARALAERLQCSDWPLAAVYASDQVRAVETAEIIAAPFDLPVLLDARLREYDFGALNDIVWRDVEFLYPEIWRAFHEKQTWLPIAGEEGHQAFRDRLAAALADIITEHQDDETVAVVTHGGSLGMILAHFLGLPPKRPQPFHFRNASLSVVRLGPWGPTLSLQNDTCHLDHHRPLPLDPA